MHVELDAFYPAVHQRDDPALKGKPVAVGERARRRVVLGCSYEARSFGVTDNMPLDEALGRCPQLVVVAPRTAVYRDTSRQMHGILRRFASPEKVETISLWEAYIDVTPAARHGTSTPEEISRRIKYAIHTEVGLIASIGAASSKLVAKVAGESRGPDALVLVPPDSEAEFMAPLPISALPNLGPRTEERLRQLGIRTMGDLGGFDTQRLVTAVGPNGAILQRLALGRDRSPVMGLQPAKTISAEVTFDQDVRDRPQLEQAMGELTRRLAGRLQADGVRARTVYVKLKLPDQSLVSRQVSRTSPTDDADVIFRAGLAALERSHLTGQAVRLMGVGLAGLIHPVSDLQMNLFD